MKRATLAQAVQALLGEFAGVPRDDLLPLSFGDGLGVMVELMSASGDEVASPGA